MSDDRDDDDREARQRAREREAEALEREGEALERASEALERAHERMRAHEHGELERIRREIERAKEREANDLECDEEREAKELEREAKELEREAKRLKREAHERERAAKVREREARKARATSSDAASSDAPSRTSGASSDDAPPPWDWRRIIDTAFADVGQSFPRDREPPPGASQAQWKRFERMRQRKLEQRKRWEERRAQHRERWRQKHRRWKVLHDEREMWMRMAREKGKRGWGPWWMQAKMRKRIFIWLTLAFVLGAVSMHFWPVLHWWHGLIALVLLSAASGGIAFRVTRPLIMVIRVAQDIGEGKLEARLDVNAHGGETHLLAVAINEMAERIEQQLKDQRQLLAAVSHELRTPLGHMRVLIDTAREVSPCKALTELEREVLTLDDLVGRLLASSRLEFGNLDCRPLDLGALVTDVATAAGVDPDAIEAIGDVRASVDPTLVRRAIANLLDNARIHGGGAVAVRIERRAHQVAIEVDDAGPGVPDDRRGDAFRAFVPSRAGGLGLGLALVSRIAVAHNGGAWITDRPGGGARVGFTVEVAPSVAAESPGFAT